MKVKNAVAIVILVIIDQITKMVVSKSLNLGQSINVIGNFFYLNHVHNEGAAFSILQGQRWVFIILTIVVLIAMYLFMNKYAKNIVERFAVTLIMAGALGNLIDRILYGYVIDFLDFYIFGYDFPVFNFADCCITVGVILFASFTLLDKEGRHDN